MVKAVAIILVVVGHTIQFGCGNDYWESGAFYDNWIFRIIYSFHMPLFMCVSGWLFARSVAKYDTFALLRNKAVALLLPLFAWNTLHYFVTMIVLKRQPLELSSWLTFMGQIWFLWALVYNMIAVIVVHRFFKDSLAVYAILYLALFFVPNSWGCANFIFMYPYFVGMYLLATRNFDFAPLRTKKVVVATAFTYVVLLAFYNRESYIYTSQYSILGGGGNLGLTQCLIDVYRMVIGFVGSLFVYQLIAWRERSTYMKCLVLIGANTLGIYVISQYAFDFLRNMNVLMELGVQNSVLLVVLYSGAILLTSYLMTVVLKKIPVFKTLFLGIKP